MNEPSDRRAVSVSIDVLLALIIISASILLLTTFLSETDDEPEIDTFEADQIADELDRTETTMEYEEPSTYDEDRKWNHQETQSYLSLIAFATIESIAIEDERLLTTTLPEELEAELVTYFAESGTDAYIHSQWRPVPGSLEGELTVGDPPPSDVDVSSRTVTYPVPYQSSIEGLDDDQSTEPDEIETRVEYVLEVFFVDDRTQRELENEGYNRERTEFRYKNIAHILHEKTGDDDTIAEFDREFDRATGTNVNAVNEMLKELMIEVIEDDLTDADKEQIERTNYEQIEITIQTWD